MRKAVWLGICGLALGLGVEAASADVVTIAFTGQVTAGDPSIGVASGQAVTGVYSYDASTPTSGPVTLSSNGGTGLAYTFASPPANMTISVAGGPTYQTQSNWTFQATVTQPAQFSYAASSPSSDTNPTAITLTYFDLQGQWLGSSVSLPTTAPPTLNGFQLPGNIYLGQGASGFYVQILTASLVPSITVSPASSSFIAQQNFDAVLLLSTQLSVSSLQASVGGTSIGFSYPGTCQLAAANGAQRTALICPNAAAVLAGLGGGPVTINWLITFADGSTAQQSVIWNLVL